MGEKERLSPLASAVCIAHMLPPFLLIADLVRTRLESRVMNYTLLPICIAWIAAGLAILVVSRRRGHVPAGASKALLSLYALLIAAGCTEFFMRISNTVPWGIGPQTPFSRGVSATDSSVMPGVFGDSRITFNEWGVRGPSVKTLEGRQRAVTILTIGGSTTICSALDDSEAWPQLLMNEINARQKEPYTFVGNLGMDGHATASHIAFLESLPVVRKADLLIFLVGVNDLAFAILVEGESSHRLMQETAQIRMTPGYRSLRYGYWARLKTVQLLMAVVAVVRGRHDKPVEMLIERRLMRSRSLIAPLPPLDLSLTEYRGRLERILKRCRELGKRCILLTQPTLWRKGLTPREESLLWLGAVGPSGKKGYVSAEELANGMNRYNETLLSVCAYLKAECYDLAAAIPKDTSAFYDDCHYNESGARMVANYLAARLVF